MLFVVVIISALLAYTLARSKALTIATGLGGKRHLHSLPNYYGWYAMWVTLLPVTVFSIFWMLIEPTLLRGFTLDYFNSLFPIDSTRVTKDLLYSQIIAASERSIGEPEYSEALKESAGYYQLLESRGSIGFTVLVISLVLFSGALSWLKISPRLRARNHVELVVRGLLILSSCIAIVTTVGIVLSVLFESLRFFAKVSITEFLFGTHWSPQIALRADQQAASGAFGAIPLFAGTLLITFIAMCVATPIGLFSAIYLAEYANDRVRSVVKPLLEILAGIPTVVYGFFAALMVAPWIRSLAESMGSQSVSSESALAAGLVMGVMIIPFVSSLSDDVIRAVPQSLRDASLAMGATRSETVKKVVLPAALPGIVGGLLLAISRAIGETMIVVMAAGLAANLTANPLESVTTITVQIVTLLVGDQEFDSAKTLAAFALGLTLFIVTLLLNIVALRIVKKYREQYD